MPQTQGVCPFFLICPMAQHSEPSIEVKNLTKRFNRITAIKDVSFSVEKGEIVGFLGPNGAGKSTTIRILCGIIPATSGEAFICGIPVATRYCEIKRKIGYMPENNPLPHDVRVAEYLKYRAHLKEVPTKKIRDRVDEVLDICELNRKTKRKLIANLSKGFRQRVGIADAILAEPEVIIMDEPTIGLDPHQIIATRRLIDNLRSNLTVVLSSHILAEIELCCDRVIIINQGHIVASGNSEKLREEFINQTRYSLTVKGSPEKWLPPLQNLDPSLKVVSHKEIDEHGFSRYTLETSHWNDQGDSILKKLHEIDGIRARAFYREEPALEDIFLAVTRRGWETSLPTEANTHATSPPPSTET